MNYTQKEISEILENTSGFEQKQVLQAIGNLISLEVDEKFKNCSILG